VTPTLLPYANPAAPCQAPFLVPRLFPHAAPSSLYTNGSFSLLPPLLPQSLLSAAPMPRSFAEALGKVPSAGAGLGGQPGLRG